MDHFLGLKQIRAGVAEVEERFVIGRWHRYVRHPWYSLALVLLWNRQMDGVLLVNALAITGYLLLGSWLEERKLERQFGEGYRRYRQRVPALLPRPRRCLSVAEAERLTRIS